MTDTVTHLAETENDAWKDLAIPVTHHAGSVTRHAASKGANRRTQVREANVRYRARRRAGRVRLVVELSRKQLDALEGRGYLDPFERGKGDRDVPRGVVGKTQIGCERPRLRP